MKLAEKPVPDVGPLLDVVSTNIPEVEKKLEELQEIVEEADE